MPTNFLSKYLGGKRNKFIASGVVVVLIIVLVVAAFGLRKSPISTIILGKPNVELKTAYKNPFDKETQYVNPFGKYKNPFVTNR